MSLCAWCALALAPCDCSPTRRRPPPVRLVDRLRPAELPPLPYAERLDALLDGDAG